MRAANRVAAFLILERSVERTKRTRAQETTTWFDNEPSMMDKSRKEKYMTVGAA
jgi:hypothetical protein